MTRSESIDRRAKQPSTASSRPALPPSATRGWIVATAFVSWIGAIWMVRRLHMFDTVMATVICLAVPTLVNYVLDIVVLKVHRRESSGLNWQAPRPSARRTAIKFVGLLASFGFILALYWLFPEYMRDFFGDHKDHPGFYGYYREMLYRLVPWFLAASIPYIYFVDARQKEPRDGYYSAGMAALLQFGKVDWMALWQHCLSWLVKGFFLALMFTFCARDTRKFIDYDFSIIQNFRTFFDFAYYFIFLADVSLACLGYFLALRLFDTHVRRTEPTFKGWLVALICYQPFWSFVSGSYLDYSNDHPWGDWLWNKPTLYTVWGSTILVLYALYFWATIMFGARFSNLTHRGILTNGPYRLTKHPAYIAKTTAYWLTFIPFIVTVSVGDSIRRCVLLAMLCGVYYLRAKTEEANLGVDPVYVQYSEWIRDNGIFRWWHRVVNDSSS